MIRLLLLLCAGIFVTLQIGGQDRGQKRFGLLEAEREAELRAEMAQTAVVEPATRAAERPLVPEASAAIMPAVFVPAQPLVRPVDQTEQTRNEGDVKYVMGRSVNVRSGPSTRDAVVGRLTRGEAVTVVWVEENGWARVRVEGDGIDGFMSMSFLADSAP